VKEDRFRVMGQQVSRVYRTLIKRPSQRFNVEHRAGKMIEKFEDPAAAPVRAPRFPRDAELMEEVRRELGEELHSKQDPELLDRLKQVYTTSQGHNPDSSEAGRPLPADTAQHYEDFVPAQMRVERPGRSLPPGRISLDQVVEALSKHRATEGRWGAGEISQQYKLNKQTVTSILQHYELFNMMDTGTRERETDRPDPLQAGPDWEVVPPPEDEAKRLMEERQERADQRVKVENMNKRRLE